ncbi:SKI/DACH domain-containing protein 1-like [Arapaima gigas]
MGDLESGYEEMEGVKLGYLVIKGKQMFALSQVFTDLLKNIPRTTVHKRMDHLNVKKHHCDLEELRKLKAINSIAFHAAKCTLISREDVEALYVSCKTERVLKSKRSKLKANSPAGLYDAAVRSEPHDTFWKEKVWLSLHGVSQPFSLKNRAGRLQETASPAASNLPQIYSKFASHGFQAGTKPACRTPKNFETTQMAGDRVPFNPARSFFRSVVCSRQPVLYQSAIALQSKLPSAADLTYKRKRQHDGTGWHLCNKSRHSRRVLLVPKCCKSKASTGSLERFHLDRELYLNHHHHHHHHHHQQQQQQQHHHAVSFQESCSSDSESSSYSERPDNDDSDFGSSLSTSSNSGSSDEEEEEEDEDDSLSESSDVTSEDDSSSESDSSSVSSQVSVQSIRFRRTSFSAFNNKAPLVTQPVFLYDQHKAKNQNGAALLDYGVPSRKVPKSDLKLCVKKQEEAGSASKQRRNRPLGSCCPASRRETVPGTTLSHFEICDDPKTAEPAINGVKEGGHSPCSKENKEFPQQRHLNAIKTEPEDLKAPPSFPNENTTARTSPTLPQNVKIKVEDNSDEYEYEYLCHVPGSGSEYQCNGQGPRISDAQHPSGEDKPPDKLDREGSSACAEDSVTTQTSPSTNPEFKSTLSCSYAEEGEYKNGARVRKNYRTLVLGKQCGIPRTPLKVPARADRVPRATGKPEPREASAEECAGTGAGSGKRKRAAGCVAAAVKKPFSFMANFPCPPSLIIGRDGDLCPAYSLKCVKDNKSPHRSHPVWKWQLGGSAVPLPPSHRFRKF